MPDLNNRPELPDIFPQNDVTVEGEVHTFKTSELDSGIQIQYEYTLNKAPVGEVQSVQGIDQSGESRTFSNGVDYEVVPKTDTVFENFTYNGMEDSQEYILTYNVDTGTETVTDSDGDTYTNGTDYKIVQSDTHYGDSLKWLADGNTPESNEPFTVEYSVTFPSSVLQWQSDGNNIPQYGSEFYVSYRAESIISRYLNAHEKELDSVERVLQEVINNKFVDTASGDALDDLGRLFGPTIGKRRGRTDVQYRIYLKSIVQSFVSRGTINGIKLAIAAATDVPIDDITINEDFEDVEYEVEVIPDTPVTVQLLEEVAEIADPSGVSQVRTRFTVDDEEVTIDESLFITEGLQIADTTGIDDTIANFGFGTEGASFEDIQSDDSVSTNPNKTQVAPDSMTVDDPSVTITQDVIIWDDASWDDFNWATEHN